MRRGTSRCSAEDVIEIEHFIARKSTTKQIERRKILAVETIYGRGECELRMFYDFYAVTSRPTWPITTELDISRIKSLNTENTHGI